MRTYEDTFSGQKIYPGKVRWRPQHNCTLAARYRYAHLSPLGFCPQVCRAERMILTHPFLSVCRANSTFEATTRFSDSKMESPNRSFCSARTLAESPGPFSTEDNTARVFQRSVNATITQRDRHGLWGYKQHCHLSIGTGYNCHRYSGDGRPQTSNDQSRTKS